MILSYESKKSDLIVECKKPTHFPPHIHEAIEMVYITPLHNKWQCLLSL